MRYMLRVHISLVELPEPPAFETDPSESPKSGEEALEGAMHSLGKMATSLLTPGGAPMMFAPAVEPGGLDYRKSVAVHAASFESATKILSEFEQLTATIQLERV